jgi:fucose 4-O-acetylase-like acetyltransferase
VVFAHAALRLLVARNTAGAHSGGQLLPDGFWIAFHDLQSFCVPLFFYISGHFLGNAGASRKTLWHSLRRLLYPYLIYSLCHLGLECLQSCKRGEPCPELPAFLADLALGRVSVYWFILLLMQYYLIGGWLAAAVKRKPRVTLALALGLQLAVSAWNYTAFRDLLDGSGGATGTPFYLLSFVPNFAFYVVLGIWTRQNVDRFKAFLDDRRVRITIVVGCLAGAAAVVLEVLRMFELLGTEGRLSFIPALLTAFCQWKLSLVVLSVPAILLLSFVGRSWLPKTRWLSGLGAYAYTIYLTHMLLADPTCWVLSHVCPGLQSGCGGFLVCSFVWIALPILYSRLVKRYAPKLAIYLLGA